MHGPSQWWFFTFPGPPSILRHVAKASARISSCRRWPSSACADSERRPPRPSYAGSLSEMKFPLKWNYLDWHTPRAIRNNNLQRNISISILIPGRNSPSGRRKCHERRGNYRNCLNARSPAGSSSRWSAGTPPAGPESTRWSPGRCNPSRWGSSRASSRTAGPGPRRWQSSRTTRSIGRKVGSFKKITHETSNMPFVCFFQVLDWVLIELCRLSPNKM